MLAIINEHDNAEPEYASSIIVCYTFCRENTNKTNKLRKRGPFNNSCLNNNRSNMS